MSNKRLGLRKLSPARMEQVKLACRVFNTEYVGALFGVSKSTVLRILRGYKEPVPGGRRRLTAEQVRRIRNGSESRAVLAREFGVSGTSITYVREFKSYKDIR